MKVLKFKCTLLTDVILNKNSATIGPNETLDFIPGSSFLGIAASTLYPESASKEENGRKGSVETTNLTMEEAWTLFHSGKVRFGDANPSLGNFRGLKVPASMFYPKLSSPDKELYIHHHIPEKNDLEKKQLKQCRKGFYDFSSVSESGIATLIETKPNFAVKSAYDRNERRAKDEQLYGYQSLSKGIDLCFSVEIDLPEESKECGKLTEESEEGSKLTEKIKKALIGKRRIGKSRSAQYGLIEIVEEDFSEIESDQPTEHKDGKSVVISVYADSRLIFLDEFGLPTFQPTPKQLLGLDYEINAEIVWKDSQIRIFSYAPWNFKRQYFDTDRCGIEKGSVFIVKVNSEDNSKLPKKLTSRYVGLYNNEGFGKVIYNPSFLQALPSGKANIKLINPGKKKKTVSEIHSVSQNITDKSDLSSDKKEIKLTAPTTLIKYLKTRRAQDNGKTYQLVNQWIDKNLKFFHTKEFASQWGEIRNIAMISMNFDVLKKNLFEESSIKGKGGYLTHGVAMEKWSANDRLKIFKTFVHSLEPDIAIDVVVNLASEMAKKCKM